MNNLQVGFAQVNANPPLGIRISGYYVTRNAKGFLDDLQVKSLVLVCGEKKIALISLDVCNISEEVYRPWLERLEAETGISEKDVFLSATHTHTSPYVQEVGNPEEDEVIKKYVDFLGNRVVDAVKLALADVKPAKMGYKIGRAHV